MPDAMLEASNIQSSPLSVKSMNLPALFKSSNKDPETLMNLPGITELVNEGAGKGVIPESIFLTTLVLFIFFFS